MEELLRLLLPKEIFDYFNIIRLDSDNKSVHLFLEKRIIFSMPINPHLYNPKVFTRKQLFKIFQYEINCYFFIVGDANLPNGLTGTDFGLKSFNLITAIISSHYREILNFFDYRSTNASAESFNAKIKFF